MSYYSVCCAADCNGAKINLEFVFDQYGPSVPQLLSRATEAFTRVFQLRGILRTFAISSAVVFNERLRCWDRLERASQLLHNSQVYLFQPDLLDLPGEIPDPIPGVDFLYQYQSPDRTRCAAAVSSSVSQQLTFEDSPRVRAPSSHVPREQFYYSSPAIPSSSGDPRASIRAQLLADMAKHRGETVPGPSILAEVREEEERKAHLDLDTHRETVRREAREFEKSLSPQRSPQ